MEFRINYARVINQADNICDLAHKLNGDSKQLDNLMQQVGATWKGPASEAYLRQCELLKSDMNETSRKKESIASAIKNVASRIQSEDEAAAERARRLAQHTGH